MGRVLSRDTLRTFGTGIAVGVVLGAAFMWLLDWRSLPASGLDDARRASLAGKWDLVAGILQRYLRRFPEDAEAQILMARADAARGNVAGSLKRLQGVSEASNWSSEARLREGMVLNADHQGARAEQAFQRAIDEAQRADGRHSIMVAARVALVQLYALQMRRDEAREQVWPVLAGSSDPAAVLELFTMIELGAEPNDTAATLERFVAGDPEDFAARRALGSQYTVLGRTSEARQILEACLSERPGDVRAAEFLAQCLLDAAEFDACEALLQRVSDEGRTKAWYWRHRGYLCERKAEWAEARDKYAEAVRLAPTDSQAHHQLGTVLKRLGEEDDGQEHLDRGLELRAARTRILDLYGELAQTGITSGGPGPSGDLCYRMGACCQSLDLPEAREWYREALRRAPGHAPSVAALMQLEPTNDQENSPSQEN